LYRMQALQLCVRTIAEGLACCVLAIAKGNGFLLGNFKGKGCKPSAFVCPITEGLIGRLATATPVIAAGFQFHYHGLFVENDRFGHGVLLAIRPASDSQRTIQRAIPPHDIGWF
jgi:hypothetical protein